MGGAFAEGGDTAGSAEGVLMGGCDTADAACADAVVSGALIWVVMVAVMVALLLLLVMVVRLIRLRVWRVSLTIAMTIRRCEHP